MSTVVLNAFLSAGFQLEAVCTRVFDPIAAEIVLQLDKLKVSGVDAAISNAQQLLESIQSGHASSLPLMNPVHVAGLTAVYLSIVMGGMFLMSRLFAQPFKVKTFALLHNLFLLSLSAFMFLFIVKESFDRGYSWFGNPVDESPTGIRVSRVNQEVDIYSPYFQMIDVETSLAVRRLGKMGNA